MKNAAIAARYQSPIATSRPASAIATNARWIHGAGSGCTHSKPQ
jgi:hypothetical protein